VRFVASIYTMAGARNIRSTTLGPPDFKNFVVYIEETPLNVVLSAVAGLVVNIRAIIRSLTLSLLMKNSVARSNDLSESIGM
jgi:hypothetical protein